MTFRILVTDEVDPEGVALLTAEPSFIVDEVPTLAPEVLLERIGDYDAFVGRSATRITAELLQRATRLRVVGRAGVGVDNIALDAATDLGIAVINAPAGNTVAVAELFFGALLGFLRHVPHAATSMRDGRWDRSKLLGSELKGRSLVIVGVGRIGGEVATRALSFGMDVAGYDPYVGDERFRALRIRRIETLDDALGEADILTLHTPLNDETAGMIGRRELARLDSGAIVCNLARGGIVDEEALIAALDAGQLGGAVVDAFSAEPLAPDHPLRRTPRVLLTPHLGASTAEAQVNVAVDACAAVRDALLHGELSRSINVAGAGGGDWRGLQPALTVTRRAAALARAILADRGVRAVQRLSLRCGPELARSADALLAAAAAGLLEGTTEVDRLNLINARALAEARGVELHCAESGSIGGDYAVQVSLSGGMQELAVAGVAPDGAPARLTRIGGFHVDVAPRDTLVILTNNDVPGVIGRVGTLLGDRGVNIGEYHQARLAQGGEALAAISVDGPVAAGVREGLLALPDVLSATIVHFRGRDVSLATERDEDVRRAYSADASGLVLVPDGIVRPASAGEVSAVLAEANAAGTPVTTAGAQTSTTGASICDRGVVLSLRGMDRIIALDAAARTVRCEPGVLVGELKRACAAQGLLLPLDPTSEEECTVGGAVACNASGARSLRYGATRPHVRALEVVLADGTQTSLRRTALEKNTVGYHLAHDPIDWFVGSEGTLGVVTEVEFALLPVPDAVIGLAIPFAEEQDALRFVVAARESVEVSPRCLEFFDRLAVDIARVAEGTPGWAAGAQGLVYVEEAPRRGEPALDAWLALADAYQATVDDVRVYEGESALRDARRLRHAVPAHMNERGAARRPHGGRKVSTDWAVPYASLAHAIGLARGFAEQAGIEQAVTYGHAGNGHPHQNFIAADATELARIQAVVEATLREVIALGGTVAAEHGIGKLKQRWLPLQMSPLQVRAMRAVKRELDPAGILAPGNVL